MIIKTRLLNKTRFDALTIGFIIFIKPNKAHVKNLIEHEKTHVRQFLKNPFMGVLYFVSKKHRLKYEVEAYRVGIQYGASAHKCAKSLSTKYNLGISFTTAYRLLTEKKYG
jgi:hypothetical protein